MRSSGVATAVFAGLVAFVSVPVHAQDGGLAAEPAPSASELPTVEVIQKKATPAPQAAQPATPKKASPVVTPSPVGPPPVEAQATGAPGSMIQMAPTPGSELPLSKVPGSVSTISGDAIAGPSIVSPNTTDALMQRVPGVIVTDLQGNQFQQDVLFHGFQSSPVNGVPQGLAVYQNGIRINEVYSDVVQWDTLPTVAMGEINVVTNNPVYGLNALGGALVITMKNGFTFQGFEADARGGSFGRVQGSVQYGALSESGNVSTYVAIEGLHDNGWRDFSPTILRRGYADLGFKGTGSEFHFDVTAAHNFSGVAGSTAIEDIQKRYDSVNTTPQTTDNRLLMLSGNGMVELTQTLSLSGTAYYRRFNQRHADGNISDLVACDDDVPNPGDTNQFCFDEDDNPVISPGLVGETFDPDEPYGSIDRTTTDANSGGGSLQLVDKAKVFGLGNQLLVGTSYDYGKVRTSSSSEFALLPPNLVAEGQGIIIEDEEGAVKPVSLGITTKYFGLYISDSLDITDALTITAGGRYNYATLDIRDRTGTSPDLNGSHTYERFNPMAGATYQLLDGLTVYGGYSEANRAPTPAELACADPEKPCLIESFLVADPPLDQVVSRTWEAGLRGTLASIGAGRIDWSVGLYRAATENEILNVAAGQQGRGYFLNAGDALRQGVDVALNYQSRWLSFYGSYSFVDATADSSYTLFSENNPNADPIPGEEGGTIDVHPGDRLPLIPRHVFKAGFDYNITRAWRFGADVLVTSSRYLLGDESNLNSPLAGYEVVNLHSSYDLSEHVQLYGLINNVFDRKYYLFGTYIDPEEFENVRDLSNPQSVMPGMPFAAYAGMRVRF